VGSGDCIGVCVADEVVVFGDCEAALLAPSEDEDAEDEEAEDEDEAEEAEDTPEEEVVDEALEGSGCGCGCGWLWGEELPEAPDELEATSSAPPSGK